MMTRAVSEFGAVSDTVTTDTAFRARHSNEFSQGRMRKERVRGSSDIDHIFSNEIGTVHQTFVETNGVLSI